MKDFRKTLKMCSYILALPLLATAVASAHTWVNGTAPINTPEVTANTTATVAAERSLIVNIDENGFVNGRVVAIDQKNANGIADLKVKFVQNGKVVKVVFTEKDGSFKVKGLAEGNYSFLASGKSAFVAHGVRVVKANGSDMLVTAAISPGFSRIYDIISSRVTPQTSSRRTVAAQTETQVPAISGNQIQVIDGKITGTVYAADQSQLAQTKIYLFKNQIQISQVDANESGRFTFFNLKPGIYDFVAAGPNGYAAASFEAIQQQNKVPSLQVSFTRQDNLPAPDSVLSEMPVVLNGPAVQGVVEQEEVIVVTPGDSQVQFLGNQNAMGTAFGEDYFYTTDDRGGFAPMFGGGGHGLHAGGHNWAAKAALAIAIIALDDDDPQDSTPNGLNN